MNDDIQKMQDDYQRRIRALEQENERLKSLDHDKTEFFNTIAHELRTPLTLLISPLESYLQDTEQHHEYIQVAYTNALRLLKLVNDVLDFAKIDAQQMPLQLGMYDLYELVVRVVKAAHHHAEKKGIALTTKTETKGSCCFDYDKIEKIVYNLISNSLKCTPTGGSITVQVYSDEEYYFIDVVDTGCGIPEQQFEHIFDRYVSRAVYEQGTGIGLALSREFARMHKGDITVRSIIGQGSCFTLSLRKNMEQTDVFLTQNESADQTIRGRDRAMIDDHLSAAEPIQRQIDAVEDTYKQHTLLVIEDNYDLRSYLVQWLSEYTVLTAATGKEGLRLAEKEKPALIITDFMLPDITGIEFCQEYRDQEEKRETPIIFLTARIDIDVKMKSLQTGAIEFMTKPFNPIELKQRIRNILQFVDLHAQYKTLYQELKKTQTQLIQTEKLSFLGRIVAGLAHELNNPLNFIKNIIPDQQKDMQILQEIHRCYEAYIQNHDLQALAEGERIKNAYPLKEHIHDNAYIQHKLQQAIDRCVALIDSMRHYARQSKMPEQQSADLNHLIADAVSFIQAARLKNIRIDMGWKLSDPVMVNTMQIQQVIINMIDNAIDAIGEENTGVITIETLREGNEALITIRDTGCGMTDDVKEKMFDPFFTTKDVGKGIGLGLGICYEIVTAHKGTISCDSIVNKGTTLTLRLPLVR